MKTISTTLLFPSLSSLQLVATDLDGTLLRSDKTISERTVALLQRLQSVGVAIVLVSARPPRVLRQIAKDFHFGGLAICCNGAIIYDLDRDSFLQEHLLSPQQIEHLVALLGTSLLDLSFAAESGKSVICEANLYPFCTQNDSPPPRIADISAICQSPQQGHTQHVPVSQPRGRSLQVCVIPFGDFVAKYALNLSPCFQSRAVGRERVGKDELIFVLVGR